MKFIVETQGQPADHLLNRGSRSTRFFHKHSEGVWRLKVPSLHHIYSIYQPVHLRAKLSTLSSQSPEEFATDTGHQSEDTRYFTLSSLDDIEQVGAQLTLRDSDEREELRALTELVKEMLQLDARERVTPAEVLQRPLFCADQLGGGETCPRMKSPERKEPQVSQRCSSPERAGDSVESEETVITQQPQSVCVSLEGEEQTAADIQPGQSPVEKAKKNNLCLQFEKNPNFLSDFQKSQFGMSA